MKNFFVLALLPLMMSLQQVQAQVSLDIFIAHKKSIDKDLILTSELQSSERIVGRDLRILEMRNGIRVEIGAEFIEQIGDEIGPLGQVKLIGRLFGANNREWLNFEEQNKIALLGEEFTFSFFDNIDQEVEIRVRPWL